MINSIPVSGVSFKGADVPEEKKQITAAEIKQKADEFTSGLDAASEGIKEATDSVTGAVATVGGATTMVGAAIKKIIPKPVIEFFLKDKLDDAGKVMLDEAGKKIQTADWKKLGIAGAITLGVTTLAIGISHICKHHKAKQSEVAKLEKIAENFDNTEKTTAAEVEE